MQVQSTVTISLTPQEALILAKFLPDSCDVVTKDETFVSEIRTEICNQLGIKPWDL